MVAQLAQLRRRPRKGGVSADRLEAGWRPSEKPPTTSGSPVWVKIRTHSSSLNIAKKTHFKFAHKGMFNPRPQGEMELQPWFPFSDEG